VGHLVSRPRLLDLFAGAGGSAVGYHRAGFDVVGVDIEPQPRYPFEFHQADALTYPLDGYDAIHASPPCQAYTQLAKGDHPRLIEPTRARLQTAGVPYVIENVVGAPLKNWVQLCGSLFGLRVRRHRRFETNFPLLVPPCVHRGDIVAVYGDHPEDAYVNPRGGVRRARSIDEARQAMGIAWMSWDEIREAIPPAYTEFIGGYLLNALGVAA
jgi:DNA (cytosine-5)-methyltransferase 1